MNIQSVIDTLNDALKRDSNAIKALFGLHVPCNDALADHPTIQVLPHENMFLVGPIGLINGVVEPLTGERIATIADDQTGELIGFTVYPKSEVQS